MCVRARTAAVRARQNRRPRQCGSACAPEPEAAAAPLQDGDFVLLSGLQGAKELNGKTLLRLPQRLVA